MENTSPVNPGLASANRVIREAIRNQLKEHCPELYAEYRKIRYPGGDGTDTDETRQRSVLYLFDTAREMLAMHYVAGPKLDAAVETTGFENDEVEGEEDESEEG